MKLRASLPQPWVNFLVNTLKNIPRAAKAIVQKGVLAAEARTAAQKAKALLRERKGALSGGGLPGKLRDCTSKDVDKCEIYLVEVIQQVVQPRVAASVNIRQSFLFGENYQCV